MSLNIIFQGFSFNEQCPHRGDVGLKPCEFEEVLILLISSIRKQHILDGIITQATPNTTIFNLNIKYVCRITLLMLFQAGELISILQT